MKNFFKSALIVLFLGIIIGSIATSGKNNNQENTQLVSVIDKFEDDIKNDHIVGDGIIDETSVTENVDTSNAMADAFSSLGNAVVDGIGKLLKFVSSALSNFIG